ncbi:hypothetical protein BOTBODRAFT_143755 [Botryobasidium botryosum FD-172 SS1]|uniref:Uncharacterized protein n=1 Tax=Botryobasidium botryosum (strain FD-172 SS1) TaxID=930990 RepID=A0A067MQN9_BOTB1|nr:hypothetical protein BOTBODRAFT_143755 [Botryobasidium botryosum FD-172 SS1]
MAHAAIHITGLYHIIKPITDTKLHAELDSYGQITAIHRLSTRNLQLHILVKFASPVAGPIAARHRHDGWIIEPLLPGNPMYQEYLTIEHHSGTANWTPDPGLSNTSSALRVANPEPIRRPNTAATLLRPYASPFTSNFPINFPAPSAMLYSPLACPALQSTTHTGHLEVGNNAIKQPGVFPSVLRPPLATPSTTRAELLFGWTSVAIPKSRPRQKSGNALKAPPDLLLPKQANELCSPHSSATALPTPTSPLSRAYHVPTAPKPAETTYLPPPPSISRPHSVASTDREALRPSQRRKRGRSHSTSDILLYPTPAEVCSSCAEKDACISAAEIELDTLYRRLAELEAAVDEMAEPNSFSSDSEAGNATNSTGSSEASTSRSQTIEAPDITANSNRAPSYCSVDEFLAQSAEARDMALREHAARLKQREDTGPTSVESELRMRCEVLEKELAETRRVVRQERELRDELAVRESELKGYCQRLEKELAKVVKEEVERDAHREIMDRTQPSRRLSGVMG